MEKIVLAVATHTKYRMPTDSVYLPIQVGAAGKENLGYTRDDTGDNISKKNLNYCELTGLYWVWKNVSADYIGLVQYRRHFLNKKSKKDKWDHIAGSEDFQRLLKDADIILPCKRNYYIESTYDQYAHAHHAIDLDQTRKIIQEKYPEYIPAFDMCMKRTAGHKFNVFVMKKDIADDYCNWLFSILFELEKRLDISGYSERDARVFGFVAERLLDVWIETNGLKYAEMPVCFMERQNWVMKGGNFLMRKFGFKREKNEGTESKHN